MTSLNVLAKKNYNLVPYYDVVTNAYVYYIFILHIYMYVYISTN